MIELFIEDPDGCDAVLIDTKQGGLTEFRIEFASNLKSVRDLRAKMLSRAFDLVKNQEERDTGRHLAYSILVLINVEVADETVANEWGAFMHSVKSELRPFLALLTWQDGEFKQPIKGTSSHTQDSKLPETEIADIIKERFKPQRRKLPQVDFGHTVATLLIKNFFAENTYFKNKALQLEAGCTYPTLQRVLEKLDPWLERDSSRSVRLRSFPKDLWWKLLSNSPSARHSTYYEDVSGQPRSIDSLLKRFKGLGEDGIAIGGVTAALYHDPKLDIVGSPRLDLIIHAPPWEKLGPISPSKLAALIDPGLAETNHPNSPIRLAIHYLRRISNGFSNDAQDGSLLADPIECLYDLHDARLTPQAEELHSFLNHNRS